MTVELTVLCEGHTEITFASQTLKPHLAAYGVYIKKSIWLAGSPGTVPFEKLRGGCQQEIGRARPHQFTTTMIDLYALRGFPEQEERQGESPRDRACRIEAGMAAQLPSSQFIPYIQVHEFEALLYVDLDELRPSFPGKDLTDALRGLRDDTAGLAPEDIDDGRKTAPSKRLIRHIPAYEYVKAIAGPQTAARIGLARMRDRCPHFGVWLGRLEGLAAAST